MQRPVSHVFWDSCRRCKPVHLDPRALPWQIWCNQHFAHKCRCASIILIFMVTMWRTKVAQGA